MTPSSRKRAPANPAKAQMLPAILSRRATGGNAPEVLACREPMPHCGHFVSTASRSAMGPGSEARRSPAGGAKGSGGLSLMETGAPALSQEPVVIRLALHGAGDLLEDRQDPWSA